MTSLDVGAHRHDTSGMGRFGGGWQLKLGVQCSRRTVVVSLLFFEVSLAWGGP